MRSLRKHLQRMAVVKGEYAEDNAYSQFDAPKVNNGRLLFEVPGFLVYGLAEIRDVAK